jgi:hypothetical protein
MKKEIFLVAVTFFILTSITYGHEKLDTIGKTGKITLILQGIKTEQANKTTAESNLSVAQNNLDVAKPDLEKSRDARMGDAKKIFDAHDGKHEEGSADHTYWQGRLNEEVAAANGFQSQIDALQNTVNEAQKQLDEANDELKNWQEQLQALGNPNTDWDCFFDGKCGTYGATPEYGKGFRIYPNGPAQGAPPIFTPLSEEYKNRHNPDNRPVAKPNIEPPQPTFKEKAMNKVKEIYNDIIRKAQQFKVRRVAVPVAVRG